MALVEVALPVAVVLVREPAMVVAEPVVESGVQAGRVVVQRAATNAHPAEVAARVAGALQAVARMAAAVVASGVTAGVVVAGVVVVVAVPQQVRAGMALGAQLGLAVTRVRMLE
jgi:hypothetical protein